MASNDSNPLPTKLQTMSLATKENITNTTTTSPQADSSVDQGLTDLPAFLTKEAIKRQEVLQKAQLEAKAAMREAKEKAPPSPATRMHRYALEVWIKAETSPGSFMPPEEESYSTDFVLDTLNLTYPGCTGIFLTEPGHAIAFYGRKGSVRAGLMVEQSTEACKLIASIPVWMGFAAKIKARAISLQEANDMIVGLKRLDKEDLKKAHMELHHWLSSWRLGNTGSNLSASAQPFVPLATSSVTGARPQGVPGVPEQALLPPADKVTQPLYTSEDEGATTEVATPKKKNRKRGSRGRRSKKGSHSRGLRVRPVTVGLRLLAVVAPPEYPTPLQDRGGTKRKVESIIKSTSQNLMVKPAILRVWVRPSTDGLEVSPITGTTMKMNILWLKSLEP